MPKYKPSRDLHQLLIRLIRHLTPKRDLENAGSHACIVKVSPKVLPASTQGRLERWLAKVAVRQGIVLLVVLPFTQSVQATAMLAWSYKVNS